MRVFNYNLRFPLPFFFFLDRYRFSLNLTFLVERVFSFFFFFAVIFIFFYKFPPQGADLSVQGVQDVAWVPQVPAQDLVVLPRPAVQLVAIRTEAHLYIKLDRWKCNFPALFDQPTKSNMII